MSHQYLPSTYFDWPARPHGLYLHDGVYNEYINYDYYAGDEIHENNVAFRGSSYISFDDTHTRWLNKTDIHMYDTSSVKLFDSGTLTMHTSASPFSRGFVVDSIGRVGIGMVHEEPHSNVMESPSFDLDVRGTVGVEDFIYHNDDTDTYMLFGADETTHYVNTIGEPNLATTTDFDEINFRVGGVDMIQMLEDGTQDHITFNKRQSDVDIITRTATNTHAVVIRGDGSETVFNEDGNSDTDFRIESNNSDKMFFVDSSLDYVEIKGAAGDDSLIFDVIGNSNAGSTGASLFRVSPTEVVVNESSNDVNFRVESDFADPAQNTTDTGTDGNVQTHLAYDPTAALFVDGSTGRVGLGTSNPDTTLHIAGSAHIEGDLWVKGKTNQVDTLVHVTSAMEVNNKGTGPALTVNQTGIQPIATFKDDGRDILFIEDLGNVGFQTNDPHTSVYINDHDGIRIPVGSTAQRPVSGDYGITGDKSTADFSAMYGTIRYNHEYQTFEGFGPGNAWGSLGGVIDIDRDTFWTALNDISGSDYPGDPDALRAFVGIDNDPEGLSGQLMMTIKKDLTIIHSPDVGIGTTNPKGELHIKGGTENVAPVKLILEGPSQAFGASFPQPMGMIGFTSSESAISENDLDVTGIHARATKDFDANSYGSELGFFTTNNFTGASTEKVTIKQDGRVGIGVTTPERELTVRGIMRWGAAAYYAYSGEDSSGLYIENVDNGTSRAKIRLQTRPNNTGNYTTLHINADDRFFRFDNGNVGVNTTPSNKLQVYTNEAHYAGHFRNDHATSGGGILAHMPNAAASRYVAYLEGHTTHFGLYVKGDGKTGIGTNTPVSTLHIVPRNGTSSSSTSSSPLYLDTPANTVSMFIGSLGSTSGYGANSYSGNIRFNGQNTSWGDFGYYPTGGDNNEYGHFRLSRAGSTVNTTPNAKLGVGDLFVNSRTGLGSTNPQARLDIQETQSTTRTTYSGAVDKAGLLISTNYTADAFTPGIFWQTDNNNASKPKGGVFMSMHSTGSHLHLGTSQNYSTGITRYVTINENGYMTIGGYDNTESAGAALDIRGWDGETTMLRVGKSMDGSQGTGAVEVTQDGTHGGGMFYNGDGSPGFVNGETADWLGFYRMDSGTRTEVFGYAYNSNDVYFNGDIYTPSAIKHTGDADTYTQFHAENEWRVVTGGTERFEVSNSETKVSNTLAIGDIKLKESADRADLLEITSTTSTWAGIQIRNSSNEGRWSFMTDGEAAGIYNDEDNQWHIYMHEGTYTRLYYNANSRLTTTSTGVDFHDADLESVKDIYVGATIYHDGDTNTYTQFEAGDKWRVVTGGSTRFRIDNSTVSSYNNVNVAKDFPKLILNSPSTGDNWTSQGAMIALGESASMEGTGTAAMYLTYNGDGKSYIGTGGVNTSSGVPNKGYIRFTYNVNEMYFSANPSIAGYTNWHSGNDGSGSGLDSDRLDGQHGSYYRNASNLNAGTYPDLFSNTTRYNIGYIDGVGSSSYDKLRVYNSSSYTIGMHSALTHGWLNDWAMTFTMNNESDRGFLWRDTSDSTAQGAMSLTTNGNLCVSNVIAVGGQTSRYLREPSGNYGSIQISGGGYGNWEGFSIDGRAVFMHDGGSGTGIYNDVNNHWLFYAVHGGESQMRHNNTWRVKADGSGAAINGRLTASGDVIAYSSDARLKTNVTTISDAIDKIKAIRGVYYDWKDEVSDYGFTPTQKHEIGLIAQEVKEVVPEVVTEAPFNSQHNKDVAVDQIMEKKREQDDETDDSILRVQAEHEFNNLTIAEQRELFDDKEFLTVRYDRLVALLIQGMNEQQEQIDTLKQEIEQLKQR